MTFLDHILLGSTDVEAVAMYGMASPGTGSAFNVVVSVSPNQEITSGCVSFTGGDTATPFGTTAKIASDGVTTISTDVSSAVGDMVVDVLGWYNGTDTAGAGQTHRVTDYNWPDNESIAMSTEAGAATVTMSHTINTTVNPGLIGVSVKAAGGGATKRRYTLTTLGVG
jgi:hypothetical protein